MDELDRALAGHLRREHERLWRLQQQQQQQQQGGGYWQQQQQQGGGCQQQQQFVMHTELRQMMRRAVQPVPQPVPLLLENGHVSYEANEYAVCAPVAKAVTQTLVCPECEGVGERWRTSRSYFRTHTYDTCGRCGGSGRLQVAPSSPKLEVVRRGSSFW